ncbi:MAG TPA: cobalamin-binding protein [Ardenticatenaceae bacterium]|nr:cobalamin-binding protein [Ardenticatenaceae bacterium]
MNARRLTLLCLAALALAALPGCTAGQPASTPPAATAAPATPPEAATEAAPTETSAPSAAASFPLTLEDTLEREVTVSARPARIVSLAPSNTEILFALGAGDQVVGVTEFCNYPPEAQSREKVGGFAANTISVEKIVALEPDLVFSAGEIHRPVIEALDQAGITVFALDAVDFDELYANIAAVGRLSGHAEEAATVVQAMQDRMAAVAATTRAIPEEERPQVFYELWHEPLTTAGPRTFVGQLIELAGGENIFGDVSEDYPEISAEEIVERDPTVILGPSTHADELAPEKLRARSGWEAIQAVSEERIYLVDGDMVTRPGPRLVDALEGMARSFHPLHFD